MMVRKKLAVMIAALGAFQTNAANALGLGEITLNSALNQPLQAQIKLLDTGTLDPSQILVNLGGKEDFERAGVSRDFFLSNLKFTVDIGPNGQGVIKIITKDNIIEPYLDFIVEARWPSGRILREYTVLLDLPVFSTTSAEPARVQNPSVAAQVEPQKAVTKSSSSYQTSVPSGQDRENLRQGSLEPGSSYRVRRDETLWEIAAKSRPNASTSVQQTMLGIQRQNPNAFFNGNINRLKAGYVLRLPTASEIADISDNRASKEVANQNRAWKTGEPAATLTEAPLDASSPNAQKNAVASDDARLSLAGTGDKVVGGNEGVGDQSSGTAALNDELSAAEEQLDQTKRQNEELAGRLNDMEAKMATLQRLLTLKEDQLSALQASKAESSVPVAAPAEKVVKVADDKVVAEPTLIDRLSENPWYLAGGVGVLSLLVIAAMLRRRKEAAEDDDEDLESFIDLEPEDESLNDLALDDDQFIEDAAVIESLDDLSDANVGDFSVDEAVLLEPEPIVAQSVQSETGDAIAEAEIYIAYGRFQQAMDLLKTAIAQEPARSDLIVKYLEVCLEARDRPSFQEKFNQLQLLGDDDAIIQVKEMLSSVDGVEDWLDGLSTSSSPVTHETMDADLIDNGLSSTDDDNFDFNLDLDDDSELELALDSNELDAIANSDTVQFDVSALNDELNTDESFSLDDLELDLEAMDNPIDSDDELLLDDLDLGDLDDGLTLDLEEASKSTGTPSEQQGESLELELDDLDKDLELDDLADADELEDLDAAFNLETTSDDVSEFKSLDVVEELSADEELLAVDSVELETPEIDDELELDLGDLLEDASDDLTDLEVLAGEELNGKPLDQVDDELIAVSEEAGELSLDELELSLDDLVDSEIDNDEVVSELEADLGNFDIGLELEESDSLDLDADIELALDLEALSDEPVADSGLNLTDNLDKQEDVALSLDLNDDFNAFLSEESMESEQKSVDEAIDLGELELDDLELDNLERDDQDFDVVDGKSAADLIGTESLADDVLTASLTASSDEDLDVVVELDSEDDDADEFDFLEDTDEVATKLDLARAYIDMGDTEGAKDIIDEVLVEGSEQQQQEAKALMQRL